jgi:hypothetical protein
MHTLFVTIALIASLILNAIHIFHPHASFVNEYLGLICILLYGIFSEIEGKK